MALKMAYSARARLDLHWFRIYCETQFPEGMPKANARFSKCLALLSMTPNMGRPAGKEPRRRFSVPNTPYTILYQVNGDLLEVARVLDQRSENYLQDLFDP